MKELIDAVADCMAFGALEHCPECGEFLIFDRSSYRCTDDVTEWTKCTYSTRKPFNIPADIKNVYDALPIYDSTLPLSGFLSSSVTTIQKQIEQLGGTYSSEIDESVGIIISSKGLQDTCHVLKDIETGNIYTPVLGLAEITRGTNLFYKMQLLESDNGKLSKNQLDKAYTVLTKLQTLITSGVTTSKTAIIDASNRFYTLIPHNCDLGSLPLLDNIELITFETKMIDNLREIEIAYSMLDESNNTIDSIDHDSEEFKLIEQYMINTHDAYTLKLCELFKTKREEEFDLFKKFQTIDNHQLLWRGSRTTDFACILSQRLRISPPEAPVTGSMLGKGVYFADMYSKSFNFH
ncbi:unnamed protein product [Rotaria sp. Silwood2]|nr:unnamed protein product [Rotaria sp. Silwood2]